MTQVGGQGGSADDTRAGLRLPEQLLSGADAATAVADFDRGTSDVDAVLVVGMGTAGTAADAVATTASTLVPVPVVACHQYLPPAFVDHRTLVLAASADGATEETLACVELTLDAGARVVAATPPGPLASTVAARGGAVVPLVPDGRDGCVSLGALTGALAVAAERHGRYPGAREWIDRAVVRLQRRRDQVMAGDGATASLARRLAGSVVVVLGAGPLGSVAAHRWRDVLATTVRAPAFAAELPSMLHGELAGWERSVASSGPAVSIVQLRHDFEHPQIDRAVLYLEEAFAGRVGRFETVWAGGVGQLAQLLDLVQVGEAVARHLAAVDGVDPSSSTLLDDLRLALRAH